MASAVRNRSATAGFNSWGYKYAQFRFVLGIAMVARCFPKNYGRWITLADDDSFLNVPNLQQHYLVNRNPAVSEYMIGVFAPGCSPLCGGFGVTFSKGLVRECFGGGWGKQFMLSRIVREQLDTYDTVIPGHMRDVVAKGNILN